MAGMFVGGADTGSDDGYEWVPHPTTGRMIRQRKTVQASGQAPLRGGSKSLSPNHIWGLDPSGASAAQVYGGGSAGVSGGNGQDDFYVGADGMNYATPRGGSGTAPSASQQQSNAAMQALINEIRGGGKDGYEGAQTPVVRSGTGAEPYDMAAENAAFGAAKERVGMSTAGALKSLREQMARRGLSGSGIEGEAMGNVFTAGLGNLANADRELVSQRADRAFSADQSNTDRAINQNQFNAASTNQGRASASSDWLARMGLLSQLTRQMY